LGIFVESIPVLNVDFTLISGNTERIVEAVHKWKIASRFIEGPREAARSRPSHLLKKN
jgi:hypothetical protein